MSTDLHYEVEGLGPVVMLSHALGCDLGMWNEVAAWLRRHYTVVRYDHRGHGASPGGHSPFGMQDLAEDAAGLIAHLGLGPVHFVGVSMGGMTAQALAASHPHLVRSITVAHSASHYDAAAQAGWRARIDTVRQDGMAAVADGALQRWLSDPYRAAHPVRVAQLRSSLLQTDAGAYAHACEAVAGIALQDGNARIRCPALVLAGALDQATPLACSEAIAAQIPGVRLEVLPVAHIGCVEQPAGFARAVHDFIAQQGG
ncbi:alpha/beta fold hydrolase [Comamonas aquatica]|uniref:alpha/beta fold hydrolase n=1 Tax=Comamonas aquatica TaxID=225991 RepID=UPI001B396C5C|nr:alpha/beta fold hydrolase [Comamonas aquatica]QTX19913.1 alpha/beta fold hydrolase [Comamonas aquatica]